VKRELSFSKLTFCKDKKLVDCESKRERRRTRTRELKIVEKKYISYLNNELALSSIFSPLFKDTVQMRVRERNREKER